MHFYGLFWCSLVDEMFYSILAFYVGLPLTLLMIGLFGIDESNKYKHLIFVILAITYMLEEYFTFSLSNMITFSKINAPEIVMFIRALAILYIGDVIKSLFSK